MKDYIESLRRVMLKPEHENMLPYGIKGSLADKLSQPGLWELATVYENE